MDAPHEPPSLPPRHDNPSLAYQTPWAPRPPISAGNPRRFLWQFLLGALGGAAVSAIAWIGGFDAVAKTGAFFLILVIPGVKLAAGVPLLCFRKWRGLGAGLMVSIGLGFLIFFGNCMTHLDQFH